MLFANATAILTDAVPADHRGVARGLNQVAGIAGPGRRPARTYASWFAAGGACSPGVRPL